ncbi:MAG: thiamine biosynthesis protein [Actinobacteria bacterium HGW-Actinobacteria-4]|nr:MAG: thiamine biosynthesis protein [Actinobacteria bacterium HGW-Actinobacteria-4]
MNAPRHQRVVHSMAMPFTVDVEGIDTRAAFDGAVAAFHADLEWSNAVFSLWDPSTPLSRYARGEITVDECPPEVGDVLDLCDHYRGLTGGAFNAERPDGTVDPTGIVKGWAVERAARHLVQAGATDWLVGASGDVWTAEGARSRRLGIADPREVGDPQGKPVVDVVELGGERRALATSGGAQDEDHIWDPVTGLPARHIRQASVIGASLVEADAWATAIVAGGIEVVPLATAAGLEVLVVTGVRIDGTLAAQASPGWPSVL